MKEMLVSDGVTQKNQIHAEGGCQKVSFSVQNERKKGTLLVVFFFLVHNRLRSWALQAIYKGGFW